MGYRSRQKKVVRIRIAGPDRQGIIATVTQFIYQGLGNIEDIDQRILEGYLIMNMLVDFTRSTTPLTTLEKELSKTAQTVGCQAQLWVLEKNRTKQIAFLVSKEDHCLTYILDRIKKGELPAQAALIIGNHTDLNPIAKQYRIPFHYVPSTNRKEHETRVIQLLDEARIDLVVLARYMQILSPEFVFRYEGRIINIHPSLLPAFPGPRSYHQAYNKGVEVVGVTAHFATTDLDEGPIITQDAFRVNRDRDTVETYIEKGRRLESRVLYRAVKLFVNDRLVLRRGKVITSKAEHELKLKTSGFYKY